mmetsp:Transcript_32934/g.97199  ORF Transcript_32934/g.97199 Transcript_32934/m.97199 type:complete len:287 (-) Transcript_32934:171-1031(-)
MDGNVSDATADGGGRLETELRLVETMGMSSFSSSSVFPCEPLLLGASAASVSALFFSSTKLPLSLGVSILASSPSSPSSPSKSTRSSRSGTEGIKSVPNSDVSETNGLPPPPLPPTPAAAASRRRAWYRSLISPPPLLLPVSLGSLVSFSPSGPGLVDATEGSSTWFPTPPLLAELRPLPPMLPLPAPPRGDGIRPTTLPNTLPLLPRPPAVPPWAMLLLRDPPPASLMLSTRSIISAVFRLLDLRWRMGLAVRGDDPIRGEGALLPPFGDEVRRALNLSIDADRR